MAAPVHDEAGIFNTARRISSPEQRQRYLDEVCGQDAGLRGRVEALLRVHDVESSFLGTATWPEPHGLEGPGTQIGPYKLLEQIGEGGFGVVYSAEQREPVRRTVALKILKPGMDTRQVIARFEAERQALALMDHPNIGRVLDGGVTPDGRPYFVMDLVKGIPITRYCDEHRLTPLERLELFIPVCQAVQHAHQKGIIHRDVKPSNVLVAAYDGRPVPKLIDFGVAKAVGQRLTDRTLVTGFGSIVGTLEYMSPEQAEFNALDIDTRSDLYGLGVLLYELLTGTTPLTRRRLQEAAVEEVLRLIREEDPPRPSTRLSDSKDSLASISAQRRLEPAQLERQIRGDLDWVVMKAIAKDRNRRYPTAGDLAEDIARHLRGDAVQARPPSAGYRLSKFVRRHRAGVAATGVAAVALVVGTAVAAWEAVTANAAALSEGQAKRRAQDKEAEILAVLDFVQRQVFAAARPEGRDGGRGPAVTVRQALKAAEASVATSFRGLPQVEARVRRMLGETYTLLGEGDAAVAQLTQALALNREHLGPDDPETLGTANSLAAGYEAQGNYPAALDLFGKTITAREAVFGPNHRDTLQSMDNLATVHAKLGHYPEALALRKRAVEIRKVDPGPTDPVTLNAMGNLANSYSEAGQLDEALRIDEEILKLLEAKYGLGHGETLATRNNLALDYAALGRFRDALVLQQGTLTLYQEKYGPDHPSTLLAKLNVAKLHADLEEYEQAIRLLNEVLPLQRIKPGPDHPDTLQTLYSLANYHGKLKHYDEALRLHREAFERRKAKLGPDNRNTLYSMWGVAVQLINVGHADEAIPLIDECLQRAAGAAAEPSFAGLADKRLRYFEAKKDPEGCRTTADLWEKIPCTDPGSYLNSARYRAVASGLYRASTTPDANRHADEQADRAMAWLRKAVAAGQRDAKVLTQDKDFAPLQGRADFRALLADLEREASKKSP